jgi:hypothetical protein
MPCFNSTRRLFLFVGISLWLPLCASAAQRLKVPDKTAQAEALSLIKQVYEEEYAAKTNEARRKLATELFKQASLEANDATSRFVLLREAITVGSECGDINTSLSAADRMGELFELDPSSLKSFALDRLAKAANSINDSKSVLDACLSTVDVLVAESNFSSAQKVLIAAKSAARKTRDAKLQTEVSRLANSVKAAEAKFDTVARYIAMLESQPDDPAANLAVGKYECFQRGNWEVGLTHLALSADEALKQLATKSIAAPEDAMAQAALGNAWWDYATSADRNLQDAIRAYAATWYKTALPGLNGLQKIRASKRIEEAAESSAVVKSGGGRNPKSKRPQTIDLIRLVSLSQDAKPADKWAIQNGQLVCVRGSFVPKVTFPYRPPEEYDVMYTFSQPRYRNGVGVIMPNSRRQASFAVGVGGSSGRHANISTTTGQAIERRFPAALAPNIKLTVVINVRKAGVTVTLNGKALLQATDYARLQVGSWHKITDWQYLAVFVDDPATFYEIKIREVSGKGTMTRQPMSK